MRDPVVFRSRFGQVLTVAIVAVSVLFAAMTVVTDGILVMLPYLPAVALLCATTTALFWLPSVTVSDSGVTLRNVLRTVELPWPSIGAVDTRFALTLTTSYGTYTAWAAPAPGRHGALSAGRDLAGLPKSTYVNNSVRPGDDAGTDSGQAALIVRRRWEELQLAGYLDDARLEAERPRSRWHWVTIAVLTTLLGTSGLVLLLS